HCYTEKRFSGTLSDYYSMGCVKSLVSIAIELKWSLLRLVKTQCKPYKKLGSANVLYKAEHQKVVLLCGGILFCESPCIYMLNET
ncbi:hypothetical protein BgiMline_021347, partial [Biomphalaria glabrata]